MTALLLSLPGNDEMAWALAQQLNCDIGHIEVRRFPDGETYLRLLSDVKGRDLIIVCTLAQPDVKILPLLFLAAAARELGAGRIGLVAPYLAYMRQDRRFNPGEAVTSRHFAKLLSDSFDWLVTVDPHLHRYSALSQIYSITTEVVQAAPLLSEWIRTNVRMPFIIGPDSESEQWVSAVAHAADAPYTVLQKIRHGDRDVEIAFGNAADLAHRTPVFVDDIISSGHTMAEAVRLIGGKTASRPFCVAVHGIFADNSDIQLKTSGATVVTTNTIPHVTNAIDVAPVLTSAITKADKES